MIFRFHIRNKHFQKFTLEKILLWYDIIDKRQLEYVTNDASIMFFGSDYKTNSSPDDCLLTAFSRQQWWFWHMWMHSGLKIEKSTNNYTNVFHKSHFFGNFCLTVGWECLINSEDTKRGCGDADLWGLNWGWLTVP